MRGIQKFHFLFLLFSHSSAAQSPTGTISGIVTDPTGCGSRNSCHERRHARAIFGKIERRGVLCRAESSSRQLSNLGIEGRFKTIIKPDITLNVQFGKSRLFQMYRNRSIVFRA